MTRRAPSESLWHGLSNGARLVKIPQDLIWSHNISQGHTKSHKVLQGLTRQGLSRPRKVLQGLTGLARPPRPGTRRPRSSTRFHKISQVVTRCQGLTKSHKVSQVLTTSHTISQDLIHSLIHSFIQLVIKSLSAISPFISQ